MNETKIVNEESPLEALKSACQMLTIAGWG